MDAERRDVLSFRPMNFPPRTNGTMAVPRDVDPRSPPTVHVMAAQYEPIRMSGSGRNGRGSDEPAKSFSPSHSPMMPIPRTGSCRSQALSFRQSQDAKRDRHVLTGRSPSGPWKRPPEVVSLSFALEPNRVL